MWETWLPSRHTQIHVIICWYIAFLPKKVVMYLILSFLERQIPVPQCKKCWSGGCWRHLCVYLVGYEWCKWYKKMKLVNIHYIVYQKFGIHWKLDSIIILYYWNEMKCVKWMRYIYRAQPLCRRCICNSILLCMSWCEGNINWDVVFWGDLNFGRINEMEFLIEMNTLNCLVLHLIFLYV